MSKQVAGLPIGFFLVTGGAVVVVVGVLGAVLYLNWGKLGLPDPEEFVQEVQEAHTGKVEGAMVVEGNNANYLKYVNREDVFVVVNYYLHYDQNNEDLKLDLKRLSARHEGKVVLMNVDKLRQSRLSANAKTVTPPDVRLMHAGDELAQFRGKDLVWDLEEMVTSRKSSLADPVRQAASETDPYAESLRTGSDQFVPEGISPR